MMISRTTRILAALSLTACANTENHPTQVLESHVSHMAHANVNSDGDNDIRGWLNGEDVDLRYTRSYFCAEPPTSGASSNCEIGAEAQVAPRLGTIPPIYAIAPVGFQPAVSTLSCLAGTPCMNHPAMIDISRIVPGATNAPAASHSHIIEGRRAGWHQTVNIRVFNSAVWTDIATAKSLDRVRELQADPAIGGAGLISQDTPTNIFFFFKVKDDR